MIPYLKRFEILDYKKRIQNYGVNGLEGIGAFHLDQLKEVFTKELHAYQDRFLASMKENPNYKYPPKYAKNNYFEYWEDRSCNYQDLIKALIVINKFRELNQTLNDSTQDRTEPAQTSSSKKTKSEDISKLKLMSIFRKPSEYDGIMEILVKEGYCQPKTFIWKFEKSGYKKFLASTIKFLHKQGYYTENKMPSGEEIKAIAKNTFGCDFSVDTIKRVNSDYCNLPLPRSDK